MPIGQCSVSAIGNLRLWSPSLIQELESDFEDLEKQMYSNDSRCWDSGTAERRVATS